LIALVWAAQSTIGASLQGQTQSLSSALRSSLVQSLAWVPVTLAIIVVAERFPFTRQLWRRRLLVHLVAALAVAYAANILVVLGFWSLQGQFNGFAALFGSGLKWTLIRLHIALLIYAAISGLWQAILYYRNVRARELQLARVESQLAQARLDALYAQIRPHFLFNTLHTIGQLWRSGRTEDADAVLDHLGSLFHQVQRLTSRAQVPLADEIALVQDYLAIEQVRFRDRLHVAIETPADTLDVMVPPLILQPLVENAVRHGASRSAAAGTVRVRSSLNNGNVMLSVTDDGPGFGTPTDQPGSGTGLRNVAERLRELYGDRAELRLTSNGGTGTAATLVIPAHG
jgi:two-component system LytT family sensor kinase